MSDPRHDLAAIRRLMEESQETIGAEGRHFVLWGLVTAVGLVGTWAAVTGAADVDVRWTWAVLVGLGWIGSFWLGYRGARRERVRTLGRRLVSVVWIGSGVTLSLIAAAALFGDAVPTRALPGLLSVAIAGSFLSTAVLAGLRWLGLVAACWWLLGGLMLFFPGLYTLPLLAAMALALEVVPGLLLVQRARRREVPQAA
jgi:hypothetical protein